MDEASVPRMSRFPNGKRFAFTVFDDTDFGTVENILPVYEFLNDQGFRTTKSVWSLETDPKGSIGGATLQDSEYRNLIQRLKEQGFEIALHNVCNHDSERGKVVNGFNEFRSLLGEYPRSHSNHALNRENIYWGPGRLNSTPLRLTYHYAAKLRGRKSPEGHLPGSQFFWADLCQQHISYVRNFVFREINLDCVNPTLPYHDPQKPFVNFFFSSCEGGNVSRFVEMLNEANQDRLEEEGGVCIMYTHFAEGFGKRQVEYAVCSADETTCQ